MRLNTLKPAPGSRRPRLRVGRGASAGQGKTCGRGVKGQRARKGGYHKVGFEGGQTPLDRRLPKFGFRSHMAVTRAEVRLHDLARVAADIIDLEALKKAGVVASAVERAKVVLSGEIKKAVTLKGIGATKGARAAIEAAGGQVLEPPAPPKPPRVTRVEAPSEPAGPKGEAGSKSKSQGSGKAKAEARAGQPQSEGKAAKGSKPGTHAEPKSRAAKADPKGSESKGPESKGAEPKDTQA